MDVYSVRVEWDEDGCHLHLATEDGTVDAKLHDPEQAYDAIKAGVGPWLIERDQAFAQFRQAVKSGEFRCDPDESGGYALEDPKHPTFHDRMSA